MSLLFAPGATSKILTVQIVDDSGLAATGLVAATFPATSYKLSTATAAVSISLTDLAAITTAYSSGGVKEISGGYYRLDVPDLALASAGEVAIIGDATGKHLICPRIVVQYVQSDVRQLLGTAWLTPAVAGTPDVNAKLIGGVAQAFPANFSSMVISGANGSTSANLTRINGLTASVTNLDNFFNGTGYAGTNNVIPRVTLTDTVTTVSDKTGYSLSATQTFNNTGTWTGNLTGSVGSVTVVSDKTGYSLTQTFPTNFSAFAITAGGAVTVGTNSDKTGYTVSTVSDKTGYSLSTGGVQAIWDALTSALTSAGSIGKWIVDKLDVVLSTRMASFVYTAPDSAATIAAAVRDVSNASPAAGSFGEAARNADAKAADIQITLGTPAVTIADDIAAIPTTAENADAVWDEATAGHATAGSTGAALTSASGATSPQAITVESTAISVTDA